MIMRLIVFEATILSWSCGRSFTVFANPSQILHGSILKSVIEMGFDIIFRYCIDARHDVAFRVLKENVTVSFGRRRQSQLPC